MDEYHPLADPNHWVSREREKYTSGTLHPVQPLDYVPELFRREEHYHINHRPEKLEEKK